MNKFSKKLALVLALTTAVATVNATPITTSAASQIVLSTGAAAPGYVYAGHSYSLKVAGTSVKFYSSDKAIATVGLTGGKLKPVKAGTVKITAKSTKTGKTVATKTFTVRQRSTAVTADSTELNLNAKDTATLTASLTPSTSTDVVRFYSTDKTVATVGATSGKVTAVADGTATIKIYAKATKATANSSKYNKVATVTVNVGPCIDTVAQYSTTKLKLTFKTDMSSYSFSASDFEIENDDTKATVAVKSVSVSEKEVTLTTYASIADGKSYTVTYGKTSGQFTATDGVISTLALETTSVPYQTLTTVYAVSKDANGIIIGKYAYGTSYSGIDFTLTTDGGYVSSEGLYLNSLTATATANVTYHTYEYNNGSEVGAITTGDVTINATSQSAVAQSGVSYSISDSSVNFSSSSYTQNTTVPAGASGYNAYFKIVDTDGTEIADYGTYTVTSSDSSVLLVNSVLSEETPYVSVTGVKTGSAYLIVKNANTSVVVATLPVTVGSKITATSLSLGATSVALSNTTTDADADSKTVSVIVKDQYASSVTKTASDYTVECVTAPSSVTASTVTEANAYFEKEANDVIFYGETGGTAFTAGTYVYKVTYGSLTSKYVSVVITAPTTTAAVQFKASLSATTADSVVLTSDDVNKTISVKVGAYQGALTKTYDANSSTADTEGIAVGTSTTNKYYFQSSVTTLTNSSGTDVTGTYLVGNTINVTYVDGAITVRKMPAGTYTLKTVVTYLYGTSTTELTTTTTTAITITDTQPSVGVTLTDNTVAAGGSKTDIAQAAYSVSYDGVTYASDSSAGLFDVDEANSTMYGTNAAGYTVAFSKLTFLFPVPAGETNPLLGYEVAIPVTSGLGSITLAESGKL